MGTACAESSVCPERSCRADEACVAGACAPWYEAALHADFTATLDGQTALVQVRPGGFPRRFLRGVRFDFGDGHAGWGESSRHTYTEPGVYGVRMQVLLEAGVVLDASRVVAVAPLGEHASRIELTLNGIPQALNGGTPFVAQGAAQDFHLLVPAHGFSVDIELLDAPAEPLPRAAVMVELAAGDGSGAQDVTARFVRRGDAEVERIESWQWRVAPSEALAPGLHRLTLRAERPDGAPITRELPFEVVELASHLDPFARPLTWLLRFDMDLFTVEGAVTSSGAVSLDALPGANGVPDFVEELRGVGAQGPLDQVNVAFLAWVKRAVVEESYRYFGIRPDGTPADGIALRIVSDDDAAAPDPADFDVEGNFSMMRYGGAFVGYLGVSLLSPYNQRRVDDTTADLGVGTASLLASLAGLTHELDALSPVLGHPVGEHPEDVGVLSGGFDRYSSENTAALNERYDALARAVRAMALAIAPIGVHEMGHAMGLMPNGAPPAGYFGGLPGTSVTGPRTNDHHADLPGLNLMQAGGDPFAVLFEAFDLLELPLGTDTAALLQILALETRFSAYARAYLQRRLTYASFDGAGSAGFERCFGAASGH